eukprot:1161675-Pelagomonas_calceolata.AAC.5
MGVEGVHCQYIFPYTFFLARRKWLRPTTSVDRHNSCRPVYQTCTQGRAATHSKRNTHLTRTARAKLTSWRFTLGVSTKRRAAPSSSRPPSGNGRGPRLSQKCSKRTCVSPAGSGGVRSRDCEQGVRACVCVFVCMRVYVCIWGVGKPEDGRLNIKHERSVYAQKWQRAHSQGQRNMAGLSVLQAGALTPETAASNE